MLHVYGIDVDVDVDVYIGRLLYAIQGTVSERALQYYLYKYQNDAVSIAVRLYEALFFL